MKSVIVVVVIMLAVAAVMGVVFRFCGTARVAMPIPADREHGAIKERAGSGSPHPFWEMIADERGRFLSTCCDVHIGDPVQRAVDILGKPTYDQVMLTDRPGRPPLRILRYYLRRWDGDLVNEKEDEYVMFTVEPKSGQIKSAYVQLEAEKRTGLIDGVR